MEKERARQKRTIFVNYFIMWAYSIVLAYNNGFFYLFLMKYKGIKEKNHYLYVNFILPSTLDALHLKKRGQILGYPSSIHVGRGSGKAHQVFGQRQGFLNVQKRQNSKEL